MYFQQGRKIKFKNKKNYIVTKQIGNYKKKNICFKIIKQKTLQYYAVSVLLFLIYNILLLRSHFSHSYKTKFFENYLGNYLKLNHPITNYTNYYLFDTYKCLSNLTETPNQHFLN